ncbi:MAG: CHASE2 domain-containing protein [Cyanobacteria bacterium P01_C01_bin.89]
MTLPFKRIQPWQRGLIIGALVSAVGILGSLSGGFAFLEWALRDTYVRWRIPEPKDDRIVIVTIDESDIQLAGQWPASDEFLAKVIRAIDAQDPHSIGLDLYRDLPVEPGNAELIELFEKTENLYGIEKVGGQPVAPPPTLDRVDRVTSNDSVQDLDGRVRRGIVGIFRSDGVYREGLASRLALKYLEDQGLELGVIDPKEQVLKIGQALFRPVTPKVGDYMPDSGGYQIFLNYRGTLDSFLHISLADVVAGRVPEGLFRDRIVLIGPIAPSTNDEFQTPYNSALLPSRPLMPGVVIHANIASQIVSAALDGRVMQQAPVKSAVLAWILAWGIGGAIYGTYRQRISKGIGVMLLGSSSILAVSYLSFNSGWSIPAVSPLLVWNMSTGSAMFISLWNALERSRDDLRKYAVTLEEKNQELKRLDELKDEFLANTSHELRTPIHGIVGLSEALIQGTAGPMHKPQEENLRLIADSGRRLANLVDDILDFAQLKNGRLELELKAVDVKGCIDAVLAVTQVLVGDRLITVTHDSPMGLPPLLGDEDRIQQILYNLIGNAIKFTEKGKVQVKAKAVTQGRGATKAIAIAVSDTGPGIAQKNLERIFESFEQGDGSTSRRHGGAGLGLAVTKQLVDLHSGSIAVSSTLGQGSTFTVTLPIADSPAARLDSKRLLRRRRHGSAIAPPAPATSLPALASEPTSNGRHQGKILIVDDEPVNLRVLENFLSFEGYSVTVAASGQEALKVLNTLAQPIDLVLLDIMMPNLSGYDVCKKIRETRLAAQLPVIMLTAKDRLDDLIMGFKCGANDYLTKPFIKDELLMRINTHIHLSKISSAYQRFVPHAYLEFLDKESILDVKLGDHVDREMAIMFSDIRGFTSMAEGMTSREGFEFINRYLQLVSPILRGHGGIIMKYLGDGVMTVFPNGPQDAISAAIAKLKAVRERRRKAVLEQNNATHDESNSGVSNGENGNGNFSRGDAIIRIGIAIHCGPIMMGIIGEKDRMQGDALSDNVNLAARLEGLTKVYGASLLVSEETVNWLGSDHPFHLRFLGSAIVKGKRNVTGLYEVFDGDGPSEFDLKVATCDAFEKAVRDYCEGRLADSRQGFSEVLDINPGDSCALYYLDRLEEAEREGLGEQWDGVLRLTHK